MNCLALLKEGFLQLSLTPCENVANPGPTPCLHSRGTERLHKCIHLSSYIVCHEGFYIFVILVSRKIYISTYAFFLQNVAKMRLFLNNAFFDDRLQFLEYKVIFSLLQGSKMQSVKNQSLKTLLHILSWLTFTPRIMFEIG